MTSPPAIKALQAFKGRTIFEMVEGVELAREWDGQAPQLMLLPATNPASFPKVMRRAAALPQAAWSRIRAGQGVVVFDAAGEGAPAEDGFLEEIHQFLAAMGVDPRGAAYITQDRGFAEDYAHLRAARGGGPRMQVIFDDYWIRRLAGEFELEGPRLFEERLAAYRARARRRPRRFVSLNLTPRPTKLVFLLSLLRDGLWDRGFISFGGLERQLAKGGAIQDIKDQLNHIGFGAGVRELAAHFAPLERMGEVLLGDGSGSRTADGAPKLSEDAALPEYGLSWFSVVTETEMRRRPSRITEKPFKPIANFHPFLVLGNPGALALLKGFGFESFGEVFDESYDEEPDPGRRFALVYDQVRRLCAADEAELDRIDRVVEAKVVANAEHLMTRMPAWYRQEVDRALLEKLEAMRRSGRDAQAGSAGAPSPAST